MEIQISTSMYNQRRYGRPWIARVTFEIKKTGDYHWGEWIGDARNGSAGILVISAQPGDVVARGQRDTRKIRNSAPEWYIVSEAGTLEPIEGAADAYRHYLHHQAIAPVPAPDYAI